MSESAEQFLMRAVESGGRVVNSNDLNEWQLSEAQANGKWWVSSDGFGWAILPWELTTDKDRDRERAFFNQSDGKNAELNALLNRSLAIINKAIMDGMPISPEVAEVSNLIREVTRK